MAGPTKDLDEAAALKKSETLSDAVHSLTSLLMASLRNALIYAPTHGQFQRAITLTEKKAREAFGFSKEIVYVCMEREILFDGRPMNHDGVQFVKLGGFLDSLNIGMLTLTKGLTADELKDFILLMIGVDEQGQPTGRRIIRSTPHIRLGRVKAGGAPRLKLSHHVITNLMAAGAVTEDEISELKSAGEETGGKALTELDADLLYRAQEAVRSFSSVSMADRVSARETLLNFVHYILKYADIIEALTPLKMHDELSYKHSLNVALLCAAQARTLTLGPDVSRELIIAGLLHDVGKAQVDLLVLNKQRPLTPDERLQVARHSEIGAAMLLKNPAVPRSSVVAAYEHHLHFAGDRGYPKRRRAERPHAISQMVALADSYDSLRTRKPYRPAYPLPSTIAYLKARSGTQYDPFLVENFARTLLTLE
ncbi:MAG: HD domain-containing phosphohydrolase [Thermodesulfobacteriota bacterium]